MIDTPVTFTASTPVANPQAAAEQHSANFAQMLTNHSAQPKDKNIAGNTDSDITALSAISAPLTDETAVSIDETMVLSDQQALDPLTANQFIDQLPIQLAVVATSLRQQASHSTLADETSEQAIVEQLTDHSETVIKMLA